jgi:hypothetical protein
MTAPASRDEWDSFLPFLRAYSLRRYGDLPVAITLHLHHGEVYRVAIPLTAPEPALRVAQMPTADDWASGPEPKRLSDFQRVYWPGVGAFTFTPKQRAVVGLLWEAWQDDADEVAQGDLLAAADSDSPRLYDLFKHHPDRPLGAGRLIVPGATPGTYRLAPLPIESDQED